MKTYSLDSGSKQTGCSFRFALVILSGILIQLALGSFFTFGNLTPYVISYLRNRTEETETRNVDALWVTTVGSVSNCFGMSAGGLLDRHFGPRIATLVGSLIFGGSVMLTSLAVRTSLVYVVITYGVVLSFGLDMAYGPPIQTAIKWLPQRSTLAAGMIVSGFGGGAITFNQVITAYINPDNVSPDLITEEGDRYFTDPGVLDRVPSCFLILGACYLAMTLVGVMGLQLPPSYRQKGQGGGIKQLESKPTIIIAENDKKVVSFIELSDHSKMSEGDKQQTEISDNRVDIKTENDEPRNEPLSIKEAIKLAFVTRAFYILWFTVMMLNAGFGFVIGLYKAYGQTFIEDDHFFALVGSMSSVFNCLGRPVWGTVMDRFGYKVAMRCISGGFAIAAATLLFTEHMNKAFFLVWICMMYFFFCGLWAVAPSTLSKLFGANNMATNYGFVYLAITVASIIGGVVGLTLKDTIGWHGLFFLSAGMGSIPFVLTFVFNGRDQYGNAF